MYVVQLPNLYNIKEEEYKNDEYKRNLYSLLKLFDQESVVRDNKHRLRIIRRFLPGFLERVIKRLQIISSEQNNLEEQMYVEDEYLKILEKRDNIISYLQSEIEKKKKTLEENKKALAEKDIALENETKRLLHAIRQVMATGANIEQIKVIFQVDEDFLKRHNLM
jgi:hypothetical protein